MLTLTLDRVLLLVVCCLMTSYCNLIHAQVPDVSFRALDYRDGLPEHFLTSEIQQDHLGRIWLATDKGLFMYNGNEVAGFSPSVADTTALTESIVQSLLIDHDNKIWIGTRNMGVCIYDPVTGIFRRYLPESLGGPLPSSRIWGMTQGSDGTVWISSRPGLIRCDPETMTFERLLIPIEQIVDDLGHNDFEFINTVRVVLIDPRDPNLLWLATRAGLASFNIREERFKVYDMPRTSRDMGLDSRNFLFIDMFFTDDENIWIASWSGGLVHFNTSTHEWRQYYEPDVDKRFAVIYDIAPKDNDELFFASRDGVGVFNIRNETFSYFPTNQVRKDGVGAYNYYFQLFLDRDSTLIIAGSRGLNISKDYPTISPVSTSAVPILSKLHVNNQPVALEHTPEHTTQVKLNKRENALSFTIAWPVLDSPGSVQYRFRLDGYNDDWVNNGGSRTVQYTNLKPGDYTFHYEARSEGMNWVSGLTNPQIDIRQPLLSHPLVLGGLGVLLMAFIGGVYHMRIRYIRREEHMKRDFSKKLAENEMKALRAQMNPHFMFNSLNSIKNYILKEDTDAASKYLTKFSKLMRAILRNSEHTLITLKAELEALRLYIEIESRRFRGAFDYSINVAEGVEDNELYVPPLLIQPYVENAIWHGLMMRKGDRRLTIDVRTGRNEVTIVVEDNGIGRVAAEELSRNNQYKKESLGMKITHDRIALIKNTLGIDARASIEDLHDAEKQPSGTRVIIKVPVIRGEYIHTIE